VHGMINETMRRHVGEAAGDDAWERIAEPAETPRSSGRCWGPGHLYGTRALVVQVCDAAEGRPSDVVRVSLER
jgi:hypothetical protein